MNNEKLERIRKVLANKTKEYVEIIKKEYKDYIPDERLKFLESIKNYEDIIKIEETGTISLFVRDDKIYFPLSAFKILKLMRFMPGSGINKKHSTFDNKQIVNDNTFSTFMKHLYIAGLKPEDYYLEILLHECMHLCGCNGSFAITEGLTELKTRELAKKYNLLTSGCGYPKEVKIVSKVQELFGDHLCNKISFSKSYMETVALIEKEKGVDAKYFYEELFITMNNEFERYISKSYPGVLGPLKKTKSYNDINYDKAWELIKDYEKKLKEKQVSFNKNVENTEKGIINENEMNKVSQDKLETEKRVLKVKGIQKNSQIKEVLEDNNIKKSR